MEFLGRLAMSLLRLMRAVVLAALFAGLIAFLLYGPLTKTPNPPDAARFGWPLLVGSCCAVLTELLLYWLRKWRNARHQRIESQIRQAKLLEMKDLIDLVDAHAIALRKNFKKALRYNDYGALVRDNREQKSREFIESVDFEPQHLEIDEATELINFRLQTIFDDGEGKAFDPNQLPLDGLDFESWVASGLTQFGWSASTTAPSGDQGVDVVAVKPGLRVAIQCKRYSSPVGNKAVQEIYSGARHIGANRAAVLTNAGYTSSAAELAQSTGVLLLAPQDIPNLDQLVA